MDEGYKRTRIHDFLRRHEVAVIATASPDGNPHAAAINFLVDHGLNVYFVARENSRKFANITRNSQVWIVVSDEDSVSSVEISGQARLIDDSNKEISLLTEFSRLSRNKNPWPMPVMRIHGSEIHLFEVEPQRFTFSDFRPTSRHEGERFDLGL